MGTYAKYAPISESGLSGLLGDKYVRSTRFATISSGTSGSVTLPPNSQVVLDDFGGTTDAIITTEQGGKPTFESATTSAGVIIATTFDSAGNYVLSGTPASYPVAIVYRVQQQLKFFDSTASNILGMSQLATIPDITGLANKTLSNLDAPTAVNQVLNLTAGGTATSGGTPFIATNPQDLITKKVLDDTVTTITTYGPLAPYHTRISTDFLMASLPEHIYNSPSHIQVIQNGVTLVNGVDYVLVNSEAAIAAHRTLYVDGINDPTNLPFIDRVKLLNGDDVNPVTVIYTEKELQKQLTLGIDVWNFNTNAYEQVDTTGFNGNTFVSLTVPRQIKENAGTPKRYLTNNLSSYPSPAPYISILPGNLLAQNLRYTEASPGTGYIDLIRLFPNMAFIREFPIDFDFFVNGYIVEIWCVHSIKNKKTKRRRSRLTPMGMWSLQNRIDMSNLIAYPKNSGVFYRQRKSRNFHFRLRRVSDNAVTPWFKGSMHVCASKRIVVNNVVIDDLFEVYYRD